MSDHKGRSVYFNIVNRNVSYQNPKLTFLHEKAGTYREVVGICLTITGDQGTGLDVGVP